MKRNIFTVIILTFLLVGCYKPYGEGVGIYYKEGSQTDYTELKADGTYQYFEKGKTINGKYSVNWNTITLVLPNGRTATGKLNSEYILDNENNKWIKKSN